MRQLTANEIARTAFKFMPRTAESLPPSWMSQPSCDSNEVCPYCKSQETSKVTSKQDLRPFEDFYKGKSFTVRECDCCEAVFSVA